MTRAFARHLHSAEIAFISPFASIELSPLFSGGEGGIRTHGTREGSTVFETARFNRSRTSPRRLTLLTIAVSYQPSTAAKTRGATIEASDSITYFGVSMLNFSQVIFSFGIAPE